MNNRWSIPLLSLALGAPAAFGQGALPGLPEANGLQPVSETIYVNTSDILNNGSTESLGIGIIRNGNVVVGWEDDAPDEADPLTYLGSVWTVLSATGQPVTQDTEITSQNPATSGSTITSRFLSFFRADGSPIPANTAWGPKIKANPFGDGFGMGATGYDLALEIPTMSDFSGDDGDFPVVQLLNNAGQPLGLVTGVPAPFHQRSGSIRIGDWHYLSTGNVVIAGESRQEADLVDVFGGVAPNRHVIVRIVSPSGEEIRAAQLASDAPSRNEMWHGVGVTRNGFGVRFTSDGTSVVRLFANDGTPTSTNIVLGAVSGSPIAGNGGRGDGVGFHGNGNDAYAAVAAGTDDEGNRKVWVTVLNADGTLRWSRSVADDLELINPGRCDVGIDSLGRVAVVFADASGTGGNAPIILGRVFNAQGEPVGGTFHVSERELPDAGTLESRNPRVAFRNDTIAVTWESQTPEPGIRVVGVRTFVLPVQPGSIESVGLTRIVPDTAVINQELDALGNWEPYASMLGNHTFLVEANAFAQDTTDMQRYVVAFQPVAGGAMKRGEGFFADNGTPHLGPINASRQNGNPGRVAGDPRPGARNFIVGAEASPHFYAPFQSANRWNTGYNRQAENGNESRYGTVQTFSLDPTTLTQAPLSLAQDAALGRLTTGQAASDQNTRYGGDVVALSNGNFLSVVEDRSRTFRTDGNAAVGTILAPDGTIVKESFHIGDGDIWANVAAVQNGFVVRVAGMLHFFNNAGERQGDPVDQNTSGESYARGRGDGERLAGHVNSPYVFLSGKVTDAPIVRVSAWDARTRTYVATADVSEGGFRGDFDRANLAVDALNRVVVSWVSRPDSYEQQQVAARVLALEGTPATFRALTPSFLPFINAAPTGNIRSVGMSVAMTTRQILIAAKGEINLQNQPQQGANSNRELNFYTVFTHPDPKDDPTPPVGGGTRPTLIVTRSGGNVTITSSPQPLPAGFVLELAPSISGPWVVQTGANTPVTVPIGTEPAVFLRARQP